MFRILNILVLLLQMGQMMTSPSGGGQSQQMLSNDPLSLQPHQRLLSVGNSLSISGNNSGGGGIPAQSMRMSKKRLDDKKTCRWVLDNGTICGKTFSKFDSLRRHVQELHKGIRPYICSLCEKSYGRRDYLDRHLKTHAADASGLGSSLGVSGDSYVGDNSGSCSVSVCDDDLEGHEDDDDDVDDDDHDDLSPDLSNVVTVITTDE